MAEHPSSPAVPAPDESASDAPVGTLQFYWFDGIVEAFHQGQVDELNRAAKRINRSGFGRGELGLDGPRYSFLPEASVTHGEGIADAARQEFVEGLDALIGLSTPQKPVESLQYKR